MFSLLMKVNVIMTFPALSDYIKMKLLREGQFSKVCCNALFYMGRCGWGECVGGLGAIL